MRPPLLLALLFSVSLLGCNGSDTESARIPVGGEPSWVEPEAPLRSSIDLNGTWSFAPEGYPFRDVQVPCFWEAYPAWPDYESCPGYLDGTPDQGLEITEGDNWDKRTIHSGTYQLDLDIQEPAPVTRVRFESIHHQATLFLNGQEMGTHTGPYVPAVFDVTDAVRKGTNTLRVELMDGKALLGPDGITRWPVGYYALTDITGLYRPVTLETRPSVYVADTFVVPSSRRNDLTLQHTLVNSTDADVRVWILHRAVNGRGVVELEPRPVEVTVPARDETTVTLVEPWEDPLYWDPVHPHLYTLRTLLLDQERRPVDLREDRFGFREVWIEDGHYVLNGMRMNLIGDSVDDQASRPRYWAMKYLSCGAAPDTLRRIKDLNFNMVRYHQAPPPECLYDLSDELGLLVISEAPVYARIDILPPFNRNEVYVENSRQWIDAWVRQNRNHPSIVMWSVENEMFMYGFGLSMSQAFSLKEPAQAADTVLRPDGITTTPRPINWDGDSPFFRFFGMEPETVNWHYPFAGFLTVYPDREWYTDAIAHFQNYLVPDVPCGVGETMIVRRTEYPNRTLDMAKAMQGAAVKAMRILGFSDIRPYKLNWAWHDFDPEGNEHPWAPYYHSLYTLEQKERLVANIRRSYHPIAVLDKAYTRIGPNPDGSFGPVPLLRNARARRKLVILNDSFMPGVPQSVSWSVFDETTSQALADGFFEISVEQGGSEERTIEFSTPAQGHALTLTVNASMEDLPQGDYTVDYAFVVH